VHGVGAARPLLADGGPSALEAFARAVAPRAVTAVLGNHDRRTEAAIARLGLEPVPSLVLGPHEVLHGDIAADVRAARDRVRDRGGRVLIGHLHPALGLDGGVGARRVVPAFVTAAGLVCLPALSPLARGGDVRSGALRAQLGAIVDERDAMGVAVVVGARVIAVGDVFSRAR
jgi:metallophosphoesterase superfamily enzyme